MAVGTRGKELYLLKNFPNKEFETEDPGAVPKKPGMLLFSAFCFWTFVLLGRPQDIFQSLALLRPALVSGAVVLLLMFFSPRDLGQSKFLKEIQSKLYLGLFSLMVIGIPFSLHKRISFMMVVTEYVYVVIYVIAFYKIVDSIRKLNRVLLFATLGTGLYAAASLASGSFSYNRLYFGGMFDPNDLAFFALSFLPLNLIFISRGNPAWKRLAGLGSFLACILLILMTGSRGGIIGFALVLFLLFLLKTRTLKFSTKVVLIILGVIFIAMNASKINLDRYETLSNLEEDYNTFDENGRIGVWKIGFRAMLSNPFIGVGVGSFNMAVGIDRARRGLPSQRWQAPHNILVQIGAETGVIGLSIFIALSINVFLILRKAKKISSSENLIKIGEMGIPAFAGLIISGMFLSQAYSIYWAFFVGLSAIVNRLLVIELAEKTAALQYDDFQDIEISKRGKDVMIIRVTSCVV